MKLVIVALLFSPALVFAKSPVQNIECKQYSNLYPNAPVAVKSIQITLDQEIDAFKGYNLYGLNADVTIEVTDSYAQSAGLDKTVYTYQNTRASKEPPMYSNEVKVKNNAINLSLLPLRETSRGVEYEGTLDVSDGNLDLWLTQSFGERPLKCIGTN